MVAGDSYELVQDPTFSILFAFRYLAEPLPSIPRGLFWLLGSP